MDIGEVIAKIKDEQDKRSVLEVPPIICSEDWTDRKYQELADLAKKSNSVNQLGVMVDLTLQYVITPMHAKYASLKRLSESLFEMREQKTYPFYPAEDSRITQIKERRLEKMNEPEMVSILRKWNVVAVMSPEKFKQIYEQTHEDRQTTAAKYS